MNAANRLVLTELIQRINAYLPRIDFGPTNPNQPNASMTIFLM